MILVTKREFDSKGKVTIVGLFEGTYSFNNKNELLSMLESLSKDAKSSEFIK